MGNFIRIQEVQTDGAYFKQMLIFYEIAQLSIGWAIDLKQFYIIEMCLFNPILSLKGIFVGGINVHGVKKSSKGNVRTVVP